MGPDRHICGCDRRITHANAYSDSDSNTYCYSHNDGNSHSYCLSNRNSNIYAID
jgi:hypothetical protein